MKNFFFVFLTASVLTGCSHSDVESTTEQNTEQAVNATHMATFDVEGMMCQKGCGAILRKGLYETGGVSEVVVNFNEEKTSNEIKVYFDKSITNTSDMINVIGGLAKNRYTAKLVKVTESTIKTVEEKEEHAISGVELNDFTNRKEVSSNNFSFPDLTRIFNGLIN
ncbi:heavy-metal-associated domain-containing protein [Brumimicrobium aurantiacum]|uniref:Copper chaperone n=1 Tax=Brumimicrobium aurantiacum TaxID=1737063 RepID=A0A3E1EUR2_9FLAO|nr:heavy-metal-associated domain-containing protein [Brumimicrobium aurantiacum]RFC53304.1 copper chaperone [Brumimicrobium aurantiacum]